LPENSKVNNVKVLGHTGKIKWNQKDNTVTVQNPTKNLEYATVIQLNLK
jgi:alpha-L-fucosidase